MHIFPPVDVKPRSLSQAEHPQRALQTPKKDKNLFYILKEDLDKDTWAVLSKGLFQIFTLKRNFTTFSANLIHSSTSYWAIGPGAYTRIYS